MKRFLIMAIMAVMAIGASAQWYAGGQLAFGQVKQTNDEGFKVKTTEFAILPEVGYNLNDSWAIGTTVGFDYQKSGDVKLFQFNVAPYARLTYFTADKLSLFVDGGVGLGFGKAKIGGKSSDTAVTYSIGFRPGIALNLTENFSLVAHVGFLGYEGGNDTAKSAGVPEQWGLNLNGNNLQFGFYYNF